MTWSLEPPEEHESPPMMSSFAPELCLVVGPGVPLLAERLVLGTLSGTLGLVPGALVAEALLPEALLPEALSPVSPGSLGQWPRAPGAVVLTAPGLGAESDALLLMTLENAGASDVLALLLPETERTAVPASLPLVTDLMAEGIYLSFEEVQDLERVGKAPQKLLQLGLVACSVIFG